MLSVKRHSYTLFSRLKSGIMETLKTKKAEGKRKAFFSSLTHKRQAVLIKSAPKKIKKIY